MTDPIVKTEQDAEQAIQAAGATQGPRITPEHIDALMDRVSVAVLYVEGTRLFQAMAFLDNDYFLASGFSACVSPENFRPELGEEFAVRNATRNAREKLWELESYGLWQKLQAEKQAAATAAPEPVEGDGIAPIVE